MARSGTPKPHGASREGSGEESDATLDPATSSVHTRRTRKRPAQMARQESADQSGCNSPFRSHTRVEDSQEDEIDTQAAEQHVQPAPASARHRNYDLRASTSATYIDTPQSSAAIETSNQPRDQPSLMQSSSSGGSSSSSILQSARTNVQQRSARSTRSNLELRLEVDQPDQHALRRTASTLQPSSIPSRSSSSRNVESVAEDSTDLPMPFASNTSQLSDQNVSSHARQPLATRAENEASRGSSSAEYTTSMTRTSSNMSPPRPTRSLPRRRASARTQTRPLLSSSNGSSSSYALRSRSTSSSNILDSTSSNANILASSSNSRQNSMTGCMPLGGGFDPSYNPPSGMSTSRTPLAEIPLWLADMRSESRRSSTSSSSFMDREEYLSAASRSMSSRHARTLSSSSSGPSSPRATRNGSTSPNVPFHRSLRGGRPRQSDENARISPSPSYFGAYDALPSPSSASMRGESGPLEDASSSNPNAGLTSSMIHLGTSSPATPSVHVQTSSPAMSTRSRTLNRADSVRNRRMTNPLNTPVPVEMSTRPLDSQGQQGQEVHASFYSARSMVPQQARTHTGDEPRSSSLLERRAATAAAAAGAGPAAHMFVRVASRPSSRTSSPARGTRASRRRSTAAEGQDNTPMEETSFGPRPANLPPLQIPCARLAPDAGRLLLHVPAPSSTITEGADGQQSVFMEPVSPSAFSEMTSLTQGSTASESMNSTAGMPATPPSSTATSDPFAQSMQHEAGLLEAGSSSQPGRTRASAVDGVIDADGDSTSAHGTAEGGSLRSLRQTSQQQHKNQVNADEDALGIQLRPRP
ncbi:hypothetical protein NDA16_000700 [Ustilago loliicola]|nr:hypothetical protein NDA16_000700 [Ustilago loliicola]